MSARSIAFPDGVLSALPQLEGLRVRLAAGAHGVALHEAVAAEIGTLERAIREQNDRWLAFHEISGRLAREFDEDRLLEGVVRHSVELLHGSGGGLTLRDETTGDLVVRLAFSHGTFVSELAGRRLGPREGLAGLVIATGHPQLMFDYQDWSGRVAGFEQLYAPSVLAVPVFVEQIACGALAVTEGTSPFRSDDSQTLVLFAQQAGAAIERVRYRQKAAALALSEERTRVARELHDGLAQDLASLLLKADRCMTLVPEGSQTLLGELDDICVGLQRSIRDARTTILALRTDPSDPVSVEDGLRAQAAHFEQRTGMPVQVCISGLGARLGSPCQCAAMLSFVREGLRNIEKHARAHSVQIELDLDESGDGRITITDDGVGFDPGSVENRAAATLHFGLLTQCDSISALGGEMRLRSGSGQGTRLEASFPAPNRHSV